MAVVSAWSRLVTLSRAFALNPLSQAFRQPPVDNVAGYVTTGNMSLARGRGSGVGAASLLALLWLMTSESTTG